MSGFKPRISRVRSDHSTNCPYANQFLLLSIFLFSLHLAVNNCPKILLKTRFEPKITDVGHNHSDNCATAKFTPLYFMPWTYPPPTSDLYTPSCSITYIDGDQLHFNLEKMSFERTEKRHKQTRYKIFFLNNIFSLKQPLF